MTDDQRKEVHSLNIEQRCDVHPWNPVASHVVYNREKKSRHLCFQCVVSELNPEDFPELEEEENQDSSPDEE